MGGKNFEQEVFIDKNNLPDELVEQPQKFYDWAKEAVLASIDTTDAKDRYEVVKAEVELRIRQHPSLHNLPDKPTESSIRATVTTNRKVRRAFKKYLDALRTEKLLAKAERAFEHRKKSLEGLVTTNTQFFFANPKIDSQTRQTIDQDELLKSARSKHSKRRITRRRDKKYG
jgi:hypothetical protein